MNKIRQLKWEFAILPILPDLKVLVCPLQLATHSSNKNPEIEMGIQASYGSSIPSYEGAGRE